MFTPDEQLVMRDLAETMHRIAGHVESLANLPAGTGAEKAVLEILDDAEEVLLKQANLIKSIKNSAQSRLEM